MDKTAKGLMSIERKLERLLITICKGRRYQQEIIKLFFGENSGIEFKQLLTAKLRKYLLRLSITK